MPKIPKLKAASHIQSTNYRGRETEGRNRHTAQPLRDGFKLLIEATRATHLRGPLAGRLAWCRPPRAVAASPLLHPRRRWPACPPAPGRAPEEGCEEECQSNPCVSCWCAVSSMAGNRRRYTDKTCTRFELFVCWQCKLQQAMSHRSHVQQFGVCESVIQGHEGACSRLRSLCALFLRRPL